MQQTALHPLHQTANAKCVDFAGWSMPLHYGSQLEEHRQVRQHAGIFDVSHMGVVDIIGDDSIDFLRQLLANDINKLKNCHALYTCMLNETGGIIDDLIVYRLTKNHFRLVINASRRTVDLEWMKQQATHLNNIQIELQKNLCILAIQGPKAIELLQPIINTPIDTIKKFHCHQYNDMMIARTGYTGEDGVEIILPEAAAVELWQSCMQAGIAPCGLGARDSLRLEAGLNLYGQDMDESTSPLSSNLTWTVCFKDEDRNFTGKAALLKEQEIGSSEQLVGIVMTSPGVLRSQQTITDNKDFRGSITSGGFSPTLGHAVGFARIPNTKDIPSLFTERRGKLTPLSIVKPPFVKQTKENPCKQA